MCHFLKKVGLTRSGAKIPFLDKYNEPSFSIFGPKNSGQGWIQGEIQSSSAVSEGLFQRMLLSLPLMTDSHLGINFGVGAVTQPTLPQAPAEDTEFSSRGS